MPMYVLDSDHLSILEWEGPKREWLKARLAQVDPAEVATTIVSFEEQTRGWMAHLARSRTLSQQVSAYARLERHLKAFCAVPVLAFSDAAAIEFSNLRKQHRRTGAMDLKIAAIVLTNDATLLTRNSADFRDISGLRIEDWTA
jgi:tRNA(fMet)-specific endonuclease VapC